MALRQAADGFPDAHHRRAYRRQVTRAFAGALRRSQPNSNGADLQSRRSVSLSRTRPQLQREFAQGCLRSRRHKKFSRHGAPLFVGQTTILRGANHEAMIEFSATHQQFVNVRAAITNACPFDCSSSGAAPISSPACSHHCDSRARYLTSLELFAASPLGRGFRTR